MNQNWKSDERHNNYLSMGNSSGSQYIKDVMAAHIYMQWLEVIDNETDEIQTINLHDENERNAVQEMFGVEIADVLVAVWREGKFSNHFYTAYRG